MHKLRLLGVLLAAGLLLASCDRRLPLENVVDAPTDAVPGTSLAAITQVIEQVGADRGWTMEAVKPGLIRGNLTIGGGKHRIEVDIAYSTESFSITYVDSVNMNYDELFDGPYIHPKYNRWVRILSEDIQEDIEGL